MKTKQAQATIEFTFAMVAVALLIFGLIRVFHWTGMDYAQRAWIRQNSTIFNWEKDGYWTAQVLDEDRPQRMVAYTHSY